MKSNTNLKTALQSTTLENSIPVLFAAIFWMLPASDSRASITLNDGGVTKLEVVSRDRTGNPSLTNTFSQLFPTSLPFDDSQAATQGASQSQATYHLGQDGFTIRTSGARDGSLDSRANVQPSIYFSVSVDTPYSLSGTLSVDDPGPTGKSVEMTAALTDLNTSGVLFTNYQASFGVVDQSFALAACRT